MASKVKRILWLTNTPSLAAKLLNVPQIGGGWISSLEEKIKENDAICLAVGFKHGKGNLHKFSNRNTSYYAIPTNSSKIQRLITRHRYNLHDDQLLKYCLEIVDDFQPDLINVFGTEEGFGLIASKIKVPVVIHLQGILTMYARKWFAANLSPRDLLTHSSIKSFLKGESLIHNYYSFLRAAHREQRIFKMCNYFMGRTDWDRRLTSILAPHAKYFTSNEILRRAFHCNVWAKQPRKFKIFISTIQPNIYKGLETILEASFILKNLNKFKFEWIIVGISRDDSIVKIFEKQIGKNFNDCNIVLVGILEADRLVKYELEADIFIHPSHIDNSANSICEAMLLGMPVIATYSGGTGSLLIDKKEGILIQDGDPYSMAGAMLDLVSNPEMAQKFGQHARERAMNRHNLDSIVNNLMNIYDEILTDPSS